MGEESPTTQDEVQRIVEAYREYDHDDGAKRRWALDNPGNRLMAKEEAEAVTCLMRGHGLLPLDEKIILDVGCGAGNLLGRFVTLGAKPHNLFGIDLLPDRVAAAARAHPGIRFMRGNAERLDFPDAHFDLVLLFTVFTSILDDKMAYNVANEIRRVLKPGGAILWSDFRYNNPRNPNVRGMTKRHITNFFQGFKIHLRSIVLLPPLSRRLGSLTATLYPLLSTIPPLRTHYVGVFIKPHD